MSEFYRRLFAKGKSSPLNSGIGDIHAQQRKNANLEPLIGTKKNIDGKVDYDMGEEFDAKVAEEKKATDEKAAADAKVLEEKKKAYDKEIDDMIFNMQNSQPYVRFDKMDNNDMAISKSFHERELRFTKEDDALLVDAGFVETDFLALQRLYYNSVVPDLKLTEKFGDPMLSGRWMEEGMLPGLKQISEE